MPLHIWGVMGAARKRFLAGRSGYPRTSQKTHSGLGTRVFGISPKYQPETAFSGWPFGIPPKYRPEQMVLAAGGRLGYNPTTSQNTHFLGSAWDIIQNQPENTFWLGIRAFGIPPKYQPEKTVLAGHSGYNPTTSQSRHFLAGARDIIQKPARKHRSGWHSGYHPNTSQKTCSGWVFRISPENQPENVFSGRWVKISNQLKIWGPIGRSFK
ncbi:hypothetical protein BYT27DRAFT_7238366 [Phlegmacium glaucopus]|nr:hypothetical protein BYT27DRAFT_7238366 [Phlegmacium glaucopus]